MPECAVSVCGLKVHIFFWRDDIMIIAEDYMFLKLWEVKVLLQAKALCSNRDLYIWV